MSDIWEDKDALARLENERDRKKGRLTFNCMKLMCKGDRAFCSLGKRLGQAKDGGMALVSALRGVTSGTCKACKDYEGGEDNE